MSNFSDSNFEAGVDEAGRGSLAGPITAAAVIFPKDYKNDYLNFDHPHQVNIRSIIAKPSGKSYPN